MIYNEYEAMKLSRYYPLFHIAPLPSDHPAEIIAAWQAVRRLVISDDGLLWLKLSYEPHKHGYHNVGVCIGGRYTALQEFTRRNPTFNFTAYDFIGARRGDAYISAMYHAETDTFSPAWLM